MSRTPSATSRHSTPAPASPPPAGDGNGRDANGRFARSNPGGPGNPFARRVAEFRKAIVEAATPEKIAAVVAKLEEKALEGDVAAAKLYLAYTVGKPGPAADPDRLDVDEGLQVRQEMGLFAALAKGVAYPLLETILDMVRTGRPVNSQSFLRQLGEGIAAIDAAEQAGDQPEPPSANGANGDGVPCQEGAPAAQAQPMANGANGGPQSPGREEESRPRKSRAGAAPPKGNGTNGGPGRRTLQRCQPQAPPRRQAHRAPRQHDGGTQSHGRRGRSSRGDSS
jgi:hypothetical protein